MPIYRYFCAKGHETELHRRIEKRQEPAKCGECGITAAFCAVPSKMGYPVIDFRPGEYIPALGRSFPSKRAMLTFADSRGITMSRDGGGGSGGTDGFAGGLNGTTAVDDKRTEEQEAAAFDRVLSKCAADMDVTKAEFQERATKELGVDD